MNESRVLLAILLGLVFIAAYIHTGGKD